MDLKERQPEHRKIIGDDQATSYQFDHNELIKRFTYHAPKGDQTTRYQYLRDFALELARAICAAVPDGRERSLALINLEQAIFWANAGIARREEWTLKS